MKVRSSLKSYKKKAGCKLVRRHGKLYIISKNPNHKVRQG